MALPAASNILASTQDAEVRTLFGWHKSSGGDGIRVFVCDPGRQRGLGLVGPVQGLVVETLTDSRLDHVEIRRDVEIARAIKRRVPDFEDLFQRLHAARHRYLRQDWIAHH